MEQLVSRDHLGQKEGRDKKARGCVVSSTCDGAGQAVVEMLRLCTQVSAFCIKEIKKTVHRDCFKEEPGAREELSKN